MHKDWIRTFSFIMIPLLACFIGVGRLAGEERKDLPRTGITPSSELEKILKEKGAEAAKKLEQLPATQQPQQPAPMSSSPSVQGPPVIQGSPAVQGPFAPVPRPAAPPSGLATPAVPGPSIQGPPAQPPVGSFPPIRGKAAAPGASQPFVSFNFDNVDLYDFVSVVSEITGVNYVIAPGVSGKITVQTTGKVATADVLPLFQTVLDVYGLAAVKSDNLYKILPSGKARQDRIEVYVGKGAQAIPAEDRLIIQVIPLDYMPAARMADILKPYISAQGSTTIHGPTNALIFTELASKIRSLLALVDVFDVDVFAKAGVKIYPLKHARAEDLAKELEKIYKGMNISDPSKEGGVEFVPIERLNSLLVISSTPKLLASAEGWLSQLDVETKEAGVRIFVHNLEHSKASEMASLLNQLYGKSDQKPRPRTERAPGEAPQVPGQPPRQPTPRRELEQLTSPLGEVEIVAYEATNSLVIRATPTDYRIVERTIKELDARPRQVLIETLIAEITLDKATEFGIQWTLTHFTHDSISTNTKTTTTTTDGKTTTTRTTTRLERGLKKILSGLEDAAPALDRTKTGLGSIVNLGSTGGTTFSLLKRIDRNLLDVTLDFLASASKVNVLSSPHIVATDNKEARIEIADEVPVRTSASTGETSGSRVVESFQFRDTGIILTVTPHINSKELVNLEVAQEVSEVGKENFGGSNNPSFQKRQAKTTVLVQNGDTLIIGGLIEETLKHTDNGIPFLKDIPLIKYLFSNRTDSLSKTELMITITPHVISTDEDAQAITEGFQRRVESLRKRMEKKKGWGKKDGKLPAPGAPPAGGPQPPAAVTPPPAGSPQPQGPALPPATVPPTTQPGPAKGN